MQKIKKVEYGKDIPKSKIIDGKTFRFGNAFSIKSNAKKYAKEKRMYGALARVQKYKEAFVFASNPRATTPLHYVVWVHEWW